jgi:8-oxo-dGTP pyrophosphatase MutT (NUDIX family)
MPSLGVETAIVVEEKVLLILRRDFAGWALPGGAVDAGESLAQAAMREAREETGLVVSLSRLVGIYSRPDWCDGGDNDVLYAAYPTSGQLLENSIEVADIGFFAPHDLPEPIVHWHKERIRDVFADGIGLTRVQHTPWPFDPNWSLGDVRQKYQAGELDRSDIENLFVRSHDDPKDGSM